MPINDYVTIARISLYFFYLGLFGSSIAPHYIPSLQTTHSIKSFNIAFDRAKWFDRLYGHVRSITDEMSCPREPALKSPTSFMFRSLCCYVGIAGYERLHRRRATSLDLIRGICNLFNLSLAIKALLFFTPRHHHRHQASVTAT